MSKYMPKHVERYAAACYEEGQYVAAEMLRAYAATLKAAQGGVTEAMVERGLRAAVDVSDARLPRYKVVRLILEAALSAQQQDAPNEVTATLKADELDWRRRQMRAVWNYFKPNASNDMEWADEIIIASQQQGEAVAWPTRLSNIPAGDGTGDRIIGFRVSEGDPILGKHGLSEPLDWLRKVTIERTAPPAQPAERVPEGFVLVPAEAGDTDAFMVLYEYQQPGRTRKDAYRIAIRKLAERASAMLTASPAPSEGGKGVDRG